MAQGATQGVRAVRSEQAAAGLPCPAGSRGQHPGEGVELLRRDEHVEPRRDRPHRRCHRRDRCVADGRVAAEHLRKRTRT